MRRNTHHKVDWSNNKFKSSPLTKLLCKSLRVCNLNTLDQVFAFATKISHTKNSTENACGPDILEEPFCVQANCKPRTITNPTRFWVRTTVWKDACVWCLACETHNQFTRFWIELTKPITPPTGHRNTLPLMGCLGPLTHNLSQDMGVPHCNSKIPDSQRNKTIR